MTKLSCASKLYDHCRNWFNMTQSQLLHSSFKLIISFTFSSLMFTFSNLVMLGFSRKE